MESKKKPRTVGESPGGPKLGRDTGHRGRGGLKTKGRWARGEVDVQPKVNNVQRETGNRVKLSAKKR